jgi:hypothetical protein
MSTRNEPEQPPVVIYTGWRGPELTIPLSTIHDLQALADERSEPGAGVSPSDLVNEALVAYLAGKEQAKQLEAVAKQTEADELERVLAVHGGEGA